MARGRINLTSACVIPSFSLILTLLPPPYMNPDNYTAPTQIIRAVCLVVQSCPTLCNPMECSPPGSPVHGDSPGKKTGVGLCAFLQGIFPTQGSNPGVPHCRQILSHLSHQGRLTKQWPPYLKQPILLPGAFKSHLYPHGTSRNSSHPV